MKTQINKVFMMTSIFLSMCLVFIPAVRSQAIQNQLISSAGGFFSEGNLQMEFSLGEPVTETFKATEMSLTQGFLQPLLVLTTVENPDMLTGINVFPNPVKAEFRIDIPAYHHSKLLCRLFDMDGKLYIRTELYSGISIFDMQDFASGTYLLHISDQVSGRKFQTKIIKIR